jgi:hypothetical protein
MKEWLSKEMGFGIRDSGFRIPEFGCLIAAAKRLPDT